MANVPVAGAVPIGPAPPVPGPPDVANNANGVLTHLFTVCEFTPAQVNALTNGEGFTSVNKLARFDYKSILTSCKAQPGSLL